MYVNRPPHSWAYYNEIDPYQVKRLGYLIRKGVIAPGVVDSRSIKEVQVDDVRGFRQCHFFAGVGGWSYALRLAGWGDDRPAWTGSCPCQPWSKAGRKGRENDPRHLWPDYHRLIKGSRPPVCMGEQVEGKAGYDWLAGVGSDLEHSGYWLWAADIPAAAVGAPQIRNRIYWLARPCSQGLSLPQSKELSGAGRRVEGGAAAECGTGSGGTGGGGTWRVWDQWELIGPDRKGLYRRIKPGTELLVNGVPERVGRCRGFGNAIVPQLAAQVVMAWMETERREG